MKKTGLLLMVALLATVAQAKWFGSDESSDLRQYVADVQGKSFQQPQDMIKAWIELKQQTFDLSAKELEECIAKAPVQNQAAIQTVIEDYKRLSRDLGAIQIPAEGYTHQMNYVSEWLDLHAKKMSLVAKQLGIIAKQLNSKAAGRMAEVKQKIADQMSKARQTAQEIKGMAEVAQAKAQAAAATVKESAKTLNTKLSNIIQTPSTESVEIVEVA